MEARQIVIPKVWRSEARALIAFVIFGAASVLLTAYFPRFTIQGQIMTWGEYDVFLTLPLFSLLPCIPLFIGIMRIYNVRYIIDSRGLETKVGILSPVKLYQRRVFFTDIRSAETAQTIMERFLNVGAVEIGTAASAGIEIVFEGVAAPHELQSMIQRERDKFLSSAHVAAG